MTEKDAKLPAPNDESSPPVALPTLSAAISAWLGFQLPALPTLPQTLKNLDKALGRLISAGLDNLSVRAEANSLEIKAQSEARIEVIRETGALLGQTLSSDSELAKRALEYTFGDSILKQRNREKIGRLAAEKVFEAGASASADAPGDIDADWLNKFSDIAAEKSNEQIQQLWAKILAGKVRQPSSFSLQSLQLLSALDTNDANLIHDILSLSINRAFVYNEPGSADISKFITAEDLGVLSGTSGILSRTFHRPEVEVSGQKRALPHFFDMINYSLVSYTDAATLQIPCFNLTRFGAELLSLTDNIVRNEDYDRSFIEYLKSISTRLTKTYFTNGQSEELLL